MNLKIDKEVSEETHKKIMELLEADNKWPVLWRAEKREQYFGISGTYTAENYREDSYDVDATAHALGLYAKTKEELQAYLDYLKAFTRLSVIGDEVDWTDHHQDKWCGIYDHKRKQLVISLSLLAQHSNMPHFLTRERAEQSIKDFEKEYITCLTFKREGV